MKKMLLALLKINNTLGENFFIFKNQHQTFEPQIICSKLCQLWPQSMRPCFSDRVNFVGPHRWELVVGEIFLVLPTSFWRFCVVLAIKIYCDISVLVFILPISLQSVPPCNPFTKHVLSFPLNSFAKLTKRFETADARNEILSTICFNSDVDCHSTCSRQFGVLLWYSLFYYLQCIMEMVRANRNVCTSEGWYS